MDIKRMSLAVIFGLTSIVFGLAFWERYLIDSQDPIVFILDYFLIFTSLSLFTIGFLLFDYIDGVWWVFLLYGGYSFLSYFIGVFIGVVELPLGDAFGAFFWMIGAPIFFVSSVALLSKLRKTEKVTKLD